ncbi:hypothetical protein [Leucobacter sp. USHLN153]|uniref:hypothetical protein n=1 Tax=Leucobacter sp. USHLN153 TaxID=3081268 RepID=UPI00301884AE
MSEHDEQPPLSRRERRMRELAETGAIDVGDLSAESTDASTQASQDAAGTAAVDASEFDIEISPVREDGTPRSRREMRELREAAIVQLLAQRTAEQGEVPADPETGSIEALMAEPLPPAAAADLTAAERAEVVTGEVVEPAPEAAPAVPAVVEAPVVGSEAAPVQEATPAEEAQAQSGVPAGASAEPDFDTLIAPPTEPFTVEELREAEAPGENAQVGGSDVPEAAQPGEAQEPAAVPVEEIPAVPVEMVPEVPAAEPSAAAGAPVAETVAAPEPAATPEPAAEAVTEVPVVEAPVADSSAAERAAVPEAVQAAEVIPPAAVSEENSADHAAAEPAVSESVAAEAAVAEPAAADPAPAEPAAAQPETTVLPTAPAEVAPSAEASGAEAQPASESSNPSQKSSYSFPDIAPPEEWRSVFDDPSSRQFPQAGTAGPSGDFDDLISRAVAQEGSTNTTGSSALILPSMPEDTGGLTGPLGATGDLYVTGSLHLPKSLGETGGHSAIHDSIEMDPITGDPMTESQAEHGGPVPVSARHAVSARVDSSVPVVAKPAREKSKLPLILSITGGGLVVVVVGLGIWGATNGFFG